MGDANNFGIALLMEFFIPRDAGRNCFGLDYFRRLGRTVQKQVVEL